MRERSFSSVTTLNGSPRRSNGRPPLRRMTLSIVWGKFT